MPTDFIFVYGTLRRSAAHPMHHLLSPATLIGPGKFRGRLYDLGNYPGAVPSENPADIVHGEVYRLHDLDATLARLDRYEGCAAADPPPTEYVRVMADVSLVTGDVVGAQIYLYQHPLHALRRIESGDFLAPDLTSADPTTDPQGTTGKVGP